jgi:hypothetical protein
VGAPRKCQVGLSAILTLLLLGAGMPTASAAVSLDKLDFSTEVGVRKGYNEYLKPEMKVQTKWSGNISDCAPGKTNLEARVATLKTINFARKLADLSPIHEAKGATKRGQAAALIMSAAENLSHEPQNDWPCYSTLGAQGAASSNLYWSSIRQTAAYWVLGYLDDYGTGNNRVEHRNWILNPETSTMGFGITPNTSALVVTGDGIGKTNPGAAGGVAWPSAGYFPVDLVPTSNRWSYTQKGLQNYGGDVTVSKNGVNIGLRPVEYFGANAAGATTIVWNMPKIEPPKPGNTDTYTIAITGVNPPVPVYEVTVIPTALPTPKVKINDTTKDNGKTVNLAKIGKVVSTSVQLLDTNTDKYVSYPPDIKLSYKWYRDGDPIPGAYDATRKMTAADAGRFISVKVTASAPGYSDVSDTSAKVWVAQGVFTAGQAAISGKAQVGNTLYAKKSEFTPSPSVITYQWYRNGMPIKGATKKQYVVKAEDKGKSIKVKITAKRDGYATVTKASKAYVVQKAK